MIPSLKLLERFEKIKVLALDCDGVMAPLSITTGIIMDQEAASQYHGRPYKYAFESTQFHHRDGQGLDLIKEDGIGIKVVVITKQRSGYVRARCHKLGIPCITTMDKAKGLLDWLGKEYPGIDLQEICFVGDDISDIGAMTAVGFAICPHDANAEVKKIAHYIARHRGGDCVVREVCDLIVAAKTDSNLKKVINRLSNIEILALDFDGTITDGYVYVNQDGVESVRCSRKDTINLGKLKSAGVKIVVISTEINKVVQTRCQKMKVDCFHGIETGEKKLDVLKRYIAEYNVMPEKVMYVGDDTNDLECLGFAGISVTVADGHPRCLEIADYITEHNGGSGALREVCDMLLEAKQN